MRNVLLLFLIFSMVFTFAHRVGGEEQKRFKEVKPAREAQVLKGTQEQLAAKRARYLSAQKMKEEKHQRHLAAAGIAGGSERIGTPNAVNLALVSGTTNWIYDSSGDLVWLGAVTNNGTSTAPFPRVDIDVYDAQGGLLGSDYTYLWGGSNVLLTYSGIYTNVIKPGETGFFRVWTDVPYATAQTIIYTFSYGNYAYADAMAQLAFDGSVYSRNSYGYAEFYGNIKNNSRTYVTYFSRAAFAVFDPTDTYVIDVDWGYVDGSTYGSSTSAIYPGGSEPFDVWFNFAAYSSGSTAFYNSFEWDEAINSGLTEKDPPFGEFATPYNHANVSSSVPVTGWALDDSGVEHVKIYRKTGGTMYYIGDASFVEGARPDVAALYPDYPNNNKAGWGYMLLTNFLPNGGNGTYELHAIATDAVGKPTTLGTRTIYCDNANAVKPFGAIDTPTQGGTASGTSYRNWGWVLTPPPNSIATDGSKINVYVHNQYKGHPIYNLPRPDIAGLFPGYVNSSGAAGYFDLDTTEYINGVYQIFWTAEDSAGNADGIGSRFFSISNTGSRMQALYQPQKVDFRDLQGIPAGTASVEVRQVLKRQAAPARAPVLDNGNHLVVTAPLQLTQLHLENNRAAGNNIYSGYLLAGKKLLPLPPGSSLDREKGIFSWAPAPGFHGSYNLVFLCFGPDGSVSKKMVEYRVSPKSAPVQPPEDK